MKKLFEEENEFVEDDDDYSRLEEFQIYYNDDSNDEFQNFGKFGIDNNWMEKNNPGHKSPYEDYEIKLLNEDLYNIYKDSPFFKKYDYNKKIPKDDLIFIFLYFIDRIKNFHQYTMIEKFLAIVEFMKMDYEATYKELPIIYKEEILKEIDKKYNLLLKNKLSNKLF